MTNDKGVIILTSFVAVGVFLVAIISTYFQSVILWPVAIIGLLFIPLILLQSRIRFSLLAEKLEKIAFVITLAVIIIGFVVIYTPV